MSRTTPGGGPKNVSLRGAGADKNEGVGEETPPQKKKVSLRESGVDLPECQERRRGKHNTKKSVFFLVKASHIFLEEREGVQITNQLLPLTHSQCCSCGTERG